MNKRIAVIDIGTQSALYLLTEFKNGKTSVIHQIKEEIRTGEGLDKTNQISHSALKRLLSALAEFKYISETENAGKTIATGTHVFRKAENASEVLNCVKNETGIEIEILNTRQEAYFSYTGALFNIENHEKNKGGIAVIDIGGGSVESSSGTGNTMRNFYSIPLGAVTLYEKKEKCCPNMPLRSFIQSELKLYKNKTLHVLNNAEKCIAAGGTATALASLDLELECYNPDLIDGHILNAKRITKQIDDMLCMSSHQLKKQLKTDPERADILPAGSVILEILMEWGCFSSAVITDKGLRFGILKREYLRLN